METEDQADAIYAAVTDNAPATVLAIAPPPVAGTNMPTVLAGGNPGAAIAQFNVVDDNEPAPPAGYGDPEF